MAVEVGTTNETGSIGTFCRGLRPSSNSGVGKPWECLLKSEMRNYRDVRETVSPLDNGSPFSLKTGQRRLFAIKASGRSAAG